MARRLSTPQQVQRPRIKKEISVKKMIIKAVIDGVICSIVLFLIINFSNSEYVRNLSGDAEESIFFFVIFAVSALNAGLSVYFLYNDKPKKYLISVAVSLCAFCCISLILFILQLYVTKLFLIPYADKVKDINDSVIRYAFYIYVFASCGIRIAMLFNSLKLIDVANGKFKFRIRIK